MKEAAFHPERVQQVSVDSLKILGLVLVTAVELPL
jgi:hypothetical protein